MLRRVPLLVSPLLVALSAAAPLACGDEGELRPEPARPAEVGSPVDVPLPDEPHELAYTLPNVWGPSALRDLNDAPDVVEVELTAAPLQKMVAGRMLNMYAFNGEVPGPLLQAKVGDTVIVHFHNDLPEPTTIHWHGVRVSEDMDGSPRIQSPIASGDSFDYTFVVPEAGSFWYHPHVRTNEQVEKGLYGPIVVRDPAEPKFDRERYLMLDDILIQSGRIAPFLTNHMEEMHGRNGNVLLTNGVAEDVVDSSEQGKVERWHLVNAANARLMSLDIPGATWKVVGTDGGRLEAEWTPGRLELAPGQRYDLEVRYEQPGQATLQSWVLVQDAQGNVVEEPRPVFRVVVAPSERAPTPIEWTPVPPRAEREITSEVTLTFDGINTATGLEWRLNHKAMSDEPLFTFDRGSTVLMHLVNQAGPYHPFHLHGQFFQVVSDGRPETDMPGLRDTVVLPGLETIDIIAYFDNPGHWMAHCHILEHAELGMMGEIVVNP